jgi:predicted thioredoxin/glutaredoxin
MENLAMQHKLQTGEALSVLTEGRQLDTSMYELNRFVEDKDYCDPKAERWIWSIGKRFKDGKIFAATDVRFHGDPNYDCLFLR